MWLPNKGRAGELNSPGSRFLFSVCAACCNQHNGDHEILDRTLDLYVQKNDKKKKKCLTNPRIELGTFRVLGECHDQLDQSVAMSE
jgi:hypothetical protein